MNVGFGFIFDCIKITSSESVLKLESVAREASLAQESLLLRITSLNGNQAVCIAKVFASSIRHVTDVEVEKQGRKIIAELVMEELLKSRYVGTKRYPDFQL
ncbi:hypothetical protein Trydic_g7168 [Trypoxylus dichotomus]